MEKASTPCPNFFTNFTNTARVDDFKIDGSLPLIYQIDKFHSGGLVRQESQFILADQIPLNLKYCQRDCD